MKNIIIVLSLLSCQLYSQSLTLDPDNSFFSPEGSTLKLLGQTSATNIYNQDKHFERVGNWKVATDTIVWGGKKYANRYY